MLYLRAVRANGSNGSRKESFTPTLRSYSPKCVEGEFLELRHDGVLGSRVVKHLTAARPTYRVCDGLQCSNTDEKGKPVARRGRKAYGPLKEVAGLPNRLERDQGGDQKEWEPSGAFRSVLRGMSLLPRTDRNRDLARLKPHLEEALERLERRRGLSDREKM